MVIIIPWRWMFWQYSQKIQNNQQEIVRLFKNSYSSKSNHTCHTFFLYFDLMSKVHQITSIIFFRNNATQRFVPWFHLHFEPNSGSILNVVRRFFHHSSHSTCEHMQSHFTYASALKEKPKFVVSMFVLFFTQKTNILPKNKFKIDKTESTMIIRCHNLF